MLPASSRSKSALCFAFSTAVFAQLQSAGFAAQSGQRLAPPFNNRSTFFFRNPLLHTVGPTLRITPGTYEYEARRLLSEMQSVDHRGGRMVASAVSRVYTLQTARGSMLMSSSPTITVSLVANSRLPDIDVIRSRVFTFTFDAKSARLLMRAFRLASRHEAQLAGLPYIAPAAVRGMEFR